MRKTSIGKVFGLFFSLLLVFSMVSSKNLSFAKTANMPS